MKILRDPARNAGARRGGKLRPGSSAVQTVLPDVRCGRGRGRNCEAVGGDARNRAGYRGCGAVNAVEGDGGGSRNGADRHTGIGAGKTPGRGQNYTGFCAIRIMAHTHCFGFQQLLFPTAAVIVNGGCGVGFTHAIDRNGGVASSAHFEGIVGKINFEGYIRVVSCNALRTAPFAVKAKAGNRIILKRAAERRTAHLLNPESRCSVPRTPWPWGQISSCPPSAHRPRWFSW